MFPSSDRFLAEPALMDLSDSNIDHQKTQTICLVIISVALATFSIYWLRPVLVPLVVALFVVSGVTPILQWLENHLGVSRLVASGISFITGLFLLVGFGVTIWVSVADLKTNSIDYRNRVESIVDFLETKVDEFGFSLGGRQPFKPSARSDEDAEDEQADRSSESIDASQPGQEDDVPDSAVFDAASGAAAASPPTETQPRPEDNRQLASEATDASPTDETDDEVDVPTVDSVVPEIPAADDPSEFVDAFLRDGITSLSQVFLDLVSNCIVVLIYVFFLHQWSMYQ